MTDSIAIIDGDLAILDSIRLVLEAENWIVRTYARGKALLADLNSEALPDCLVLEPQLPDAA